MYGGKSFSYKKTLIDDSKDHNNNQILRKKFVTHISHLKNQKIININKQETNNSNTNNKYTKNEEIILISKENENLKNFLLNLKKINSRSSSSSKKEQNENNVKKSSSVKTKKKTAKHKYQRKKIIQESNSDLSFNSSFSKREQKYLKYLDSDKSLSLAIQNKISSKNNSDYYINYKTDSKKSLINVNKNAILSEKTPKLAFVNPESYNKNFESGSVHFRSDRKKFSNKFLNVKTFLEEKDYYPKKYSYAVKRENDLLSSSSIPLYKLSQYQTYDKKSDLGLNISERNRLVSGINSTFRDKSCVSNLSFRSKYNHSEFSDSKSLISNKDFNFGEIINNVNNNNNNTNNNKTYNYTYNNLNNNFNTNSGAIEYSNLINNPNYNFGTKIEVYKQQAQQQNSNKYQININNADSDKIKFKVAENYNNKYNNNISNNNNEGINKQFTIVNFGQNHNERKFNTEFLKSSNKIFRKLIKDKISDLKLNEYYAAENNTNYNNVINDNNNDSLNSESKRILIKNIKIFDSLSEDEDMLISNNYVIDMDSVLRFLLDFSVFLGIFYAFAITPLKIVDFIRINYFSVACEIALDAIFAFDVLSGFFNAYFDLEENYVNNQAKIVKNYLDKSFAWDLISCFPFNSILEISEFFKNETEKSFVFINYNKNFNKINITNTNDAWIFDSLYHRNNSIFFLLRFIRLVKLKRYFNFENKIISSLNNLFNKDNQLLNLLKHFSLMYFLFLLVSNILTCLFIFFAAFDRNNWITASLMQNEPFSYVYLSSLYFVHTTIFSVGYGDLVSKNFYEKCFNILLMILGVFLFSFALTALSNIIKTQAEKHKFYNENKQFLNELQKTYEIKNSLHQKILRHFFFVNKSNEKNKNILLNDLPITLKRELVLNMNKELVSKCKFFCNDYLLVDKEFLVEILACLKQTISHENESLIKQGDFVEEVIFVRKGLLQLSTVISIELDLHQYGIMRSKGNFNGRKNRRLKKLQDFQNKFYTENNKNCNEKEYSNYNNLKKNHLLKDKKLNKKTISADSLKFKKSPYNNNNNNNNNKNFTKEINNSTEIKKDFDPNCISKLKIGKLRKNEYFGDSLIIDNVRSEFTLKTKSKIAELFLIDKFDFLNLLKEKPAVFEYIYMQSNLNILKIYEIMKIAKKIEEGKAYKSIFESLNYANDNKKKLNLINDKNKKYIDNTAKNNFKFINDCKNEENYDAYINNIINNNHVSRHSMHKKFSEEFTQNENKNSNACSEENKSKKKLNKENNSNSITLIKQKDKEEAETKSVKRIILIEEEDKSDLKFRKNSFETNFINELGIIDKNFSKETETEIYINFEKQKHEKEIELSNDSKNAENKAERYSDRSEDTESVLDYNSDMSINQKDLINIDSRNKFLDHQKIIKKKKDNKQQSLVSYKNNENKINNNNNKSENKFNLNKSSVFTHSITSNSNQSKKYKNTNTKESKSKNLLLKNNSNNLSDCLDCPKVDFTDESVLNEHQKRFNMQHYENKIPIFFEAIQRKINSNSKINKNKNKNKKFIFEAAEEKPDNLNQIKTKSSNEKEENKQSLSPLKAFNSGFAFACDFCLKENKHINIVEKKNFFAYENKIEKADSLTILSSSTAESSNEENFKEVFSVKKSKKNINNFNNKNIQNVNLSSGKNTIIKENLFVNEKFFKKIQQKNKINFINLNVINQINKSNSRANKFTENLNTISSNKINYKNSINISSSNNPSEKNDSESEAKLNQKILLLNRNKNNFKIPNVKTNRSINSSNKNDKFEDAILKFETIKRISSIKKSPKNLNNNPNKKRKSFLSNEVPPLNTLNLLNRQQRKTNFKSKCKLIDTLEHKDYFKDLKKNSKRKRNSESPFLEMLSNRKILKNDSVVNKKSSKKFETNKIKCKIFGLDDDNVIDFFEDFIKKKEKKKTKFGLKDAISRLDRIYVNVKNLFLK